MDHGDRQLVTVLQFSFHINRCCEELETWSYWGTRPVMPDT
jgi:hypothetical protein